MKRIRPVDLSIVAVVLALVIGIVFKPWHWFQATAQPQIGSLQTAREGQPQSHLYVGLNAVRHVISAPQGQADDYLNPQAPASHSRSDAYPIEVTHVHATGDLQWGGSAHCTLQSRIQTVSTTPDNWIPIWLVYVSGNSTGCQ
jgi:hypothetical protein